MQKKRLFSCFCTYFKICRMCVFCIYDLGEYFLVGLFWERFLGSLGGFSGCCFLARRSVTNNCPWYKKTPTLSESYLLSFRYVAACSFTLLRNSVAASNSRSPDFRSAIQFTQSFPCVVSFPQLSHG